MGAFAALMISRSAKRQQGVALLDVRMKGALLWQAEREQEHSEGGHGQSSISRRPAPMPLEAMEKVQAAQVT